jgi:hypothetical protein
MSFQGIAPIRFGSVSMVTATLGPNDPEVGTRTTVNGRDYVFVYNEGGTTISQGMGAVIFSTASGYSVTVSSVTSADICVGVCYHADIATTKYGWLVTKGIVPVEMMNTAGTVAAQGLIEIAGNGLFAPVSNTTGNKAPAVGKALAEIVSNASGAAYISCY